ncbi:MAG: hypothetical protein HYR96_05895 [Deltaproteobacteria bacterium]|nr:hypothetical protein [Deltaproteobacteria bacterium]MBI3295784.1 hypothetical protein [Deltaproteobacteria bacterium]
MQSLELIPLFIAPLEKSGLNYFVTGSIASIFYGEPRLTHDIDIVIHLSSEDIAKFLVFYPSDNFYCPPEEVIQIEARRRPFGHFNLIHHKTGMKADIYPDSDDSLYRWAFKNRKRVALADGANIWLAPPEYLIIRKLEYYREGASDKHLEDIKKMLPQIQFDSAYLENEIASRELTKQWKKIQG